MKYLKPSDFIKLIENHNNWQKVFEDYYYYYFDNFAIHIGTLWISIYFDRNSLINTGHLLAHIEPDIKLYYDTKNLWSTITEYIKDPHKFIVGYHNKSVEDTLSVLD